ncbi:TetR/AcrR family transcriptional regulator [Balneolaceae bacterium YR4-1]|uniref:TetR/AcrR family transcriptional regulator n=1 Tax=Halalkalibaculum roseum TaxID=2709311 RepID=A0A6M1TCR4_9BACT|nr:TetR/AcrR family transcriptional regulator [Halalkalibaculum roseum]NGP77953.1 TetR/AcrR family transcriptional regulator [Halalkalibaculum roseum]
MSDQRGNILEAALDEFAGNGLAGARLKNIADDVGVTKAMIHYYFGSKENLFKEVFAEAYHTVIGDLMNCLEKDESIFVKIEEFIEQAVDRFHIYPSLVDFLVNAMNKNPESTVPLMRDLMDYDSSVFENQLQEAASQYEIAAVNCDQVVLNMLSLCMFPYGARVFMSELLHKESEQAYRELLEQRKGIITDTIINWLAS